jgi:hypothetical protein
MRLTKNNKGDYYYPECFERCGGLGTSEKCNECDFCYAICEKLGEYEDLEEQGRLIKLPCRIGDTVYVKMAPYCKTHYAEAEVKDFVHFISCGFCIVVTSKYFDKQNIPFSEFGKTVFLTKPEAEAKLKELRGENE